MAEVYFKQNKKDMALSYTRRALEIDPSLTEAKDLLSRLGQ
jgi:hypothetical protein